MGWVIMMNQSIEGQMEKLIHKLYNYKALIGWCRIEWVNVTILYYNFIYEASKSFP